MGNLQALPRPSDRYDYESTHKRTPTARLLDISNRSQDLMPEAVAALCDELKTRGYEENALSLEAEFLPIEEDREKTQREEEEKWKQNKEKRRRTQKRAVLRLAVMLLVSCPCALFPRLLAFWFYVSATVVGSLAMIWPAFFLLIPSAFAVILLFRVTKAAFSDLYAFEHPWLSFPTLLLTMPHWLALFLSVPIILALANL